ncbi:EH signature domain-containing protein [Corallococcus sp. bb12-1]|uniref:EH signature domain-containing protein n=1 Tax=Corallococcus sp. bb12-1 TaxID=2996784 RepID=UPI0022717EDD|nr:EH signature domain-containing protein [Corallococcus sp. bb12-1]MCY1043680.1 EH signature domain-containing protein [Corallococcus sp. bb12-1]
MGLDSWLDEVRARQKTFLAGLSVFHQQIENGVAQLAVRVEEAQSRSDDREPERLQRTRQTLNVEAVLKKLDSQDFSSLSRREQRAVPALWREVGLDRMDWFLSRSPESLPRLVRQRLRDWSTSEEKPQQDAWARLAGKCPVDAGSLRWGLPMSIESALGQEGPRILAKHWLNRPLQEAVEMLRNLGLKPGVNYTGHVVAEHLRRRLQGRQDVSEGLKFLVDDRVGRAWMPHNNMDNVAATAPLEARVAVVAASLECWARGQAEAGVRGRLEERLIARDSVFVDPRLTELTHAWTLVRGLAESAFDAFLTVLIQQDLEFFFERAMHEEDRRRFWLCYLGSIRRTTCWLDSATYDSLARKLATLPAEQQAAFRRAKRFPEGAVSAFCLSFDRYSVVEFSQTNNATFIYPQGELERMRKGKNIDHADHLKDQTGAYRVRKLIHLPRWELRFEQELLGLGIERDKSGRRIGS